MVLPNPITDRAGSEPRFGRSTAEMYEEDGDLVLTFELPGFERDDIDLVWDEEGRRLKVAAEHYDEGRDRRRTYHRAFRAPKEVDPDAIDATYRNGVLEVTLPIADGEKTGRVIEIDAE